MITYTYKNLFEIYLFGNLFNFRPQEAQYVNVMYKKKPIYFISNFLTRCKSFIIYS